jgi:hypothetical protein
MLRQSTNLIRAVNNVVDSYPGPGGGCSHIGFHSIVSWWKRIYNYNIFLQYFLEVIHIKYVSEITISDNFTVSPLENFYFLQDVSSGKIESYRPWISPE